MGGFCRCAYGVRRSSIAIRVEVKLLNHKEENETIIKIQIRYSSIRWENMLKPKKNKPTKDNKFGVPICLMVHIIKDA